MSATNTNEGVGAAFQRATRYERGSLPEQLPHEAHQPERLKRYPGAKRVALAPVLGADGPSLWMALQKRRSVHRYSPVPLTLAELSRLCWAAQGVTARRGEILFRTAPSAGALYPIETYLVVNHVDGVEPGIYHYAVAEHALEELKLGDFGEDVARSALDQTMLRDAALVFVWTAVWSRSTLKYAQRAYRYVYLDVGHVAENVALAASALALGSCQVGALYDDEAAALLDVDGENEAVIYMTAVGRPG